MVFLQSSNLQSIATVDENTGDMAEKLGEWLETFRTSSWGEKGRCPQRSDFFVGVIKSSIDNRWIIHGARCGTLFIPASEVCVAAGPPNVACLSSLWRCLYKSTAGEGCLFRLFAMHRNHVCWFFIRALTFWYMMFLHREFRCFFLCTFVKLKGAENTTVQELSV